MRATILFDNGNPDFTALFPALFFFLFFFKFEYNLELAQLKYDYQILISKKYGVKEILLELEPLAVIP